VLRSDVGCRERSGHGSYGPTLERACFDEHGLSEWVEIGLQGPRRLSLRRTRPPRLDTPR
jgi:hypothetical protein